MGISGDETTLKKIDSIKIASQKQRTASANKPQFPLNGHIPVKSAVAESGSLEQH